MSTEVPLLVAAFRAEAPRGLGWPLVLTGPGRGGGETPALPGRSAVIVTGTCGALRQGPVPGELVLPARLISAAGRERHPDPALRGRLAAAARRLGLAVHEEGLAGAESVVDEPADRAALAAATGCAFVDLESAQLAEAAASAGRPWVVLRFVSDGPDAPLAWLGRLYGGWPEAEPGALRTVAALARRPWLLGRLLGLARVVAGGRRAAGMVLAGAFEPTRGAASA